MSNDDWKSPGFRQNVAARIENAIRESGNPTTKTASEMENHFFTRANNKEEYLNYLARLLIHIKELRSKNQAQGVGVAGPQGNIPQNVMVPQQQQLQQQQQQQQQQNVNAANLPQGPMMNQMNVRPQMMDQQQQHQMMNVNNQQQQQISPMVVNQPMNQMGGINQQQQHMAPMNPQQMQQQQLHQQQQHQHQLQQQQQQFQQNSNQQQNQANTNMNMGNTLMQQLNAPSQQQAANNPSSALLSQLNQTQQQQTMGPMNPVGMQRPRFPVQAAAGVRQQQSVNSQQQQAAQQQQLINQQQQQQMLLQQQQQQQRKQQSEMMNQQQGQQPQFVAGPGIPSPAQQQAMPMQSMAPMSSTMTVHNMGAPSPAYVHSPGNVQLVSSPASGVRMTAPQHQPMQQAGRQMAGLPPPPSPSMMNIQVPTPGMLHTPQGAGMGGGMIGHGGGPVPGTEDHLYLDKVRQLSRFIEPLTKLISRFGEDDSEKLGKMKIMLDILSNPSKRMPMDTLLKCEAVLEKMDFKKSETGSIAPPSVASVPSLGVLTVKDPAPSSGLHPLLETIANQARSPYINHTLQRTFSPAVNALVGCDIAPPSFHKKRSIQEVEEDGPDELMDTIEREVANMDPRFKVDFHQLHLTGSLDLHLTCGLEDKVLPSVPPLHIVVPRDYPRTAPRCDSQQSDYDVNPFTRTVLQSLLDRLRHMPQRYSISQILNCWEMALRHACRPHSASKREVNSSSLTVALGI